MFEYSQMPAVSSIYHEIFFISEDTHVDQNQFSDFGKSTVQPVQDKELRKKGKKDGEVSPRTPEDTQPERERPKRGPARFHNPDPILPGLQIKLSQDFQVKVIVLRIRGHQWTGPTA